MSATFIDKVSRAYDSVYGSSTPTMPSQNVQTGKFLVLYLRASAASSLYGCSGVTDTAGNTWVQAGTNTYTSGTTVECWYVLSSTANASNVVTMTFGGVNDYLEATCLQYTFTPTATPVDVFAVTTSGGGTGDEWAWVDATTGVCDLAADIGGLAAQPYRLEGKVRYLEDLGIVLWVRSGNENVCVMRPE